LIQQLVALLVLSDYFPIFSDINMTSHKTFLWKVRLWLLGQSLIYGFGMVVLVKLIPAWGHWYSLSPFYSTQENALLQGDLALSHSLSDLNHDLAWACGGIQQVWGLGIPILRLPLAILAHLFGYLVFPEHVATGVAISMFGFWVLINLVEPAIMRRQSPFAVLPSLGCVVLLLLFPPFWSLFTTKFMVYEEAAAHVYLYGVFEAVLLLQWFRKPTRGRWFTLMLVAGFGAFVRPTLVFYGFGVWLVGTLDHCWLFRNSRKVVTNEPGKNGTFPTTIIRWEPYSWCRSRFCSGAWLCGSSLFFLGILALLLTNWIRFGSPTEFGHKLNVQIEVCNGSLCATRFDHPFETEPFPVVLKELVAALFIAKPYYASEYYYQPEMFWGQAKALRMRELYFKAYDGTYILPLLGTACMVGYWWWRSLRGPINRRDALLMKMGMWCVFSIAPVFWFYLRTPALFSRYLLDFAPGFAVLIAVGWFALATHLKPAGRVVAILLLAIWVSCEIASARKFGVLPATLTWSEAASRHKIGMEQKPNDLFRLGNQTTTAGESGIPYDGNGWSSKTQAAMPHVTIFVKNPMFLELELARAPDYLGVPDPDCVRAKIGLEFLRRESVVREGEDLWRIRFQGPQRRCYIKDIQVAFVMVVPNTHLADETTPWILRRVRWRDKPQPVR
jgi:hypothetical protein